MLDHVLSTYEFNLRNAHHVVRGMTPEQLLKVMMPFGQIRKAGDARSGTGLGLPFCLWPIPLFGSGA